MKKFALLAIHKKGKTEKKHMNRIAFQGGSYSLAITAVVLAILVVLNVLVSAIPSAYTKYDISSTKLYSITSNTKVVVNALKKDVTIYWIVQSGEEDDVIENLLSKYDSLSDHVDVVKKNPDIYPTFAEQYTSEEVSNNRLIVECGDRSRFISYNDIYISEANMTTYSYDNSFDGEGAITSAIDYVVNEEQPQLYMLEGHGEAELPESFSEQIEKENIELNTFSLLNEDSVPEEADCILIYAPSSDISAEEKDMLVDYVENGGKMMVLAGPTEDGTLENLYSLLSNYGVEAEEGIVVESDREHYAFQAPYVLLPDIASNEITDPLLEENYYAIMPIAQGMTVKKSDNASVTELLTTSDTSFSKVAGYSLTSYEKEDGDIDGPFAVAVSIDCANDGQIIWFSSSEFLNDMYNSYSSGANLDLGMNALSSMMGENEAVAIRSKSLNYSYLTISDSTASILKTVMIGAFPLAYLAIGFVVILRRSFLYTLKSKGN
ncbi:MAG: GldG family protein [Lachnospiraceae bacterium]